MMDLHYLLSPWCDVPDIAIQRLETDSRHISYGDVFVAIQGFQFDARSMIGDAIKKGAVAVIADAGKQALAFSTYYQDGVLVVAFPQLKAQLSALAARFYHQDKAQLPVIGVTGTNGKTTITQLIAQWLSALDRKTAVMGTTGNGFLQQLHASDNTTGNAVDIQRELANFRRLGADYVAMEVSSHGLVQQRVQAVQFAATVFSNLSRDHLDYHGSMQCYAEAKLRLFIDYDANIAVINADDETGYQWLRNMPNAIAVSLHEVDTRQGRKALWLTQVHYRPDGVTINFDSSWGRGQFNAMLVGEFNVMNLLLSLATLLALGVSLPALLAVSDKLKPVMGRMEVFQTANKPMLVVDYAHTPDALEKALAALRRHCEGKLWCVFGCGGDRDNGKRPLMASIAERAADCVILTNDNPRSESPEQIMAQMLAGMTAPENAKCIYSRFDACRYAFEHASKNDVILIAGKGHEDYQILDSGRVHYSDRETARYLIEAQG